MRQLQYLSEQLRINEHEIEQRKRLLELFESDFARLRACNEWLEVHLNTIVKEFYIQQVSIPEIAMVIGDQETLNNLHQAMTQYIRDLFSGDYDEVYVNKRLRIGKIHQRIGVGPKLYLSAISRLQQILEQHIYSYSQEADATVMALRKLFHFDNQWIFDTYIGAMQNKVELAYMQLEEYAANLERTVEERTEELKQLSMRDPLTQLYNQRAFYEELDKNINIANRSNHHMCLLYIDLNKFKEVNDNHGHKAGDEVLIAFSTATRKTLRKSETAARLGGDEFCIIMPNTAIEEAHHLCTRLVEEFESSTNYDVGLSIGGASIFPHSDIDSEQLLYLADAQMYQAKRIAHQTGKSEFRFEQSKQLTSDDDNVSKLEVVAKQC